MLQAEIGSEGFIALPHEIIEDLRLVKGDKVYFKKTSWGYMLLPVLEGAKTTAEQRLEYTRFILEGSDEIMNTLTEISLADDEYTEDEIYLTNTIAEKVMLYQEYLKKIIADGIVTVDEYHMIQEYEEQIMEIARVTADRDGISEDEQRILDGLQDIFEKIKPPK
ncbi:MAG: hypothetical protein INQ03_15200 [Candidatus Heimdallarchaeota archaeon]|nr:hypothetical protein [Candidatus Heimdallarchaeota archaeon]